MVKTLPAVFFEQVQRRGGALALRHKEHGVWKRVTWSEYGERVRQVGHLSKREGRQAVRAWDSRKRAVQLVDPKGLGSLQWLWLATPGCGWWRALDDLEDLF